jgi:hypothetical protein
MGVHGNEVKHFSWLTNLRLFLSGRSLLYCSVALLITVGVNPGASHRVTLLTSGMRVEWVGIGFLDDFYGSFSTMLGFEHDGLQIEQKRQKVNIDWFEFQDRKQDVRYLISYGEEM